MKTDGRQAANDAVMRNAHALIRALTQVANSAAHLFSGLRDQVQKIRVHNALQQLVPAFRIFAKVGVWVICGGGRCVCVGGVGVRRVMGCWLQM